MKPNDMPLVCLPLGLCDDDVATLLQFLYDLTEGLERHYAAELLRREHRRHTTEESPLDDPTDPPF
jgi:hypothetical protein